jgi:16S rRNA processing protein RimM
MTNEKKICVGRIASAHGIRGEVKLISYTEPASAILDYPKLTDNQGNVVKFSKTGVKGESFIVRMDGVSDRTKAESIRGKEFFITRDMLNDIEDGTYYHVDLVGLKVKSAAKEYGQVVAVHNFGAGDILEFNIASDKKKTYMITFIEDSVLEVNIKTGHILINEDFIVN